MLTYLNLGVSLAFCLAIALGLWLGLVPDVVSNATAAWTAGTLLFLVGFSATMIERARPTRSIAHVLYDVEHPIGKR